MKRVLSAVLLSGLGVSLLTGCGGGSGESIDERNDRRYEACIEAGGSYKQEPAKWSCTMPEEQR